MSRLANFMGFEKNRQVWNLHYREDRSKQQIPDENLVRYFTKYFTEFPSAHPVILDLGSGSGRNLNFIRSFPATVFGCDFALEALKGQQNVLCSRTENLPFPDASFDIVAAWGVLHYLTPENAEKSLKEIQRILKPEGIFFGTLRSSKDTHLLRVLEEGDLKGGGALTYTEEETREFFHNFSKLTLGHITRRPLGEAFTVAHHIFEAVK